MKPTSRAAMAEPSYASPGSNDYPGLHVHLRRQPGRRAGRRYRQPSGDPDVVNSTFSGNGAGTGGAIQNFSGAGQSLLRHPGGQQRRRGRCTWIRQRLRAMWATAASASISTTPSWPGDGNCAISDTPGPLPHFVSGGYNLAEDNTCAFFLNQTGDVNNTPAQLGAPTDNGGGTLTHLPGAASPLVDAAPVCPILARINEASAGPRASPVTSARWRYSLPRRQSRRPPQPHGLPPRFLPP